MFIPFLYISSLDLSAKVDLFRSSSFLIKTSISLVILFKMIVFNLIKFCFLKYFITKKFWLVYFVTVNTGVVCLFKCFYKVHLLDKLGVASKESIFRSIANLNEWRILYVRNHIYNEVKSRENNKCIRRNTFNIVTKSRLFPNSLL